MLIIIINWSIIFTFFYVLGYFVNLLIEKMLKCTISFRNRIISGLVVATVYSEMFSIFYKVGKVALVILALICAIIIITTKKRFVEDFYLFFKSNIASNKHYIVFIIGVVLVGAFLTSQQPVGYDTYNYDVPSIRWIEEFGVVTGLGNLHTRFAYNSSFLCLQALFSFSWLLGASQHSVNGFLWTFLVLVCLKGLIDNRNQNICFSNVSRVIFLFILLRVEEIKYIQSPNTDFMPLCLISYVFIEWIFLDEKNNQKNNNKFKGLLCILCVFCITVKLSAAIVIILALKPAYELIKTKSYKSIILFVILSVLIVSPYLIRNIIISGYLLYPVSTIDLFSFDWEMPKCLVMSDKEAIKLFARAWGKGWAYRDTELSFIEWFFRWIRDAEYSVGFLSIIDFLLSIFIIIRLIYSWKNKKNLYYDYIIIAISSLGFWFLLFTAPAIRFGRWWFYIVPVSAFFCCVSRNDVSINVKKIIMRVGGFKTLFFCCCIVLSYIAYILIACRSKDWNASNILFAQDYTRNGADGDYYLLNGIKFYYYTPNDDGTNNLNSYDGFPGTECKKILEKIEMRGENLKDGFRVSEQYRVIPFSFQGEVISNYVLSLWGKYDYITIRKDEVSDYKIVTDQVTYNLELDQKNKEGRKVVGWAFVNEIEPSDDIEICVDTGRELVLCSKENRLDVSRVYNLDLVDVGFAIVLDTYDSVQICIIDNTSKTIYY